MVGDLLADTVDGGATARHRGQLVAEDGRELPRDAACLLEVLKDKHHVLGLLEELPRVVKVPSRDGELVLDRLTRAEELGLPALEHLDTGPDVSDSVGGPLLGEDGADVDLVPDLLADLVGDGLKDVLELLDIVVDVARDGPDELQSVKERPHSLGDGLQLTFRDDLELALEGLEELHEVLGLGLSLLELLVGCRVLVKDVVVLVVLVAQELEDLPHCWHLELLVQSVEGR